MDEILIFGNTFVECRKCHKAYDLIGNIEKVNKHNSKVIYIIRCPHCRYKDKMEIGKG